MEQWMLAKIERTRDDMISQLEENSHLFAIDHPEKAYGLSALTICRSLWKKFLADVPVLQFADPSHVPEEQYQILTKMNQGLRKQIKEQNKIAHSVFSVIIGPVDASTRTFQSIMEQLEQETTKLRDEMFNLQHAAKETGFVASEFTLADYLRLAEFKLNHAASHSFGGLGSEGSVQMDLRLQQIQQEAQSKIVRLDRQLEMEKQSTKNVARSARVEYEELQKQSTQKLDKMKSKYESEIKQLHHSYDNEISVITHDFDMRIAQLQQQFDSDITGEKEFQDEARAQAVQALRETLSKEKEKLEAHRASLCGNLTVPKAGGGDVRRGSMYPTGTGPLIAMDEDVHAAWTGEDKETLVQLLQGKRAEIEMICSRHNLQTKQRTMEWASALREIIDRYEHELKRLHEDSALYREKIESFSKLVDTKSVEIDKLKSILITERTEFDQQRTILRRDLEEKVERMKDRNRELESILDQNHKKHVELQHDYDTAKVKFTETEQDLSKMYQQVRDQLLDRPPRPTIHENCQTDPITLASSSMKTKVKSSGGPKQILPFTVSAESLHEENESEEGDVHEDEDRESAERSSTRSETPSPASTAPSSSKKTGSATHATKKKDDRGQKKSAGGSDKKKIHVKHVGEKTHPHAAAGEKKNAVKIGGVDSKKVSEGSDGVQQGSTEKPHEGEHTTSKSHRKTTSTTTGTSGGSLAVKGRRTSSASSLGSEGDSVPRMERDSKELIEEGRGRKGVDDIYQPTGSQQTGTQEQETTSKEHPSSIEMPRGERGDEEPTTPRGGLKVTPRPPSFRHSPRKQDSASRVTSDGMRSKMSTFDASSEQEAEEEFPGVTGGGETNKKTSTQQKKKPKSKPNFVGGQHLRHKENESGIDHPEAVQLLLEDAEMKELIDTQPIGGDDMVVTLKAATMVEPSAYDLLPTFVTEEKFYEILSLMALQSEYSVASRNEHSYLSLVKRLKRLMPTRYADAIDKLPLRLIHPLDITTVLQYIQEHLIPKVERDQKLVHQKPQLEHNFWKEVEQHVTIVAMYVRRCHIPRNFQQVSWGDLQTWMKKNKEGVPSVAVPPLDVKNITNAVLDLLTACYAYHEHLLEFPPRDFVASETKEAMLIVNHHLIELPSDLTPLIKPGSQPRQNQHLVGAMDTIGTAAHSHVKTTRAYQQRWGRAFQEGENRNNALASNAGTTTTSSVENALNVSQKPRRPHTRQ